MLTVAELQDLSQCFVNVDKRSFCSEEVLDKIVTTLKYGREDQPCREQLVLESIRVLRNVVAGVPHNQIIVAIKLENELDLWELFRDLVRSVINGGDGSLEKLNILRCFIQLVGNLMVGQTELQVKQFPALFNLINVVMEKIEDLKCLNYSGMVLLTLIKNESQLSQSIPEFHTKIVTLLPTILTLLERPIDSDFLLLCIKSLVTSEAYLSLLDTNIRTSSPVLHLLSEMTHLTSPVLCLLSSDFTKQTDILLTTQLGSIDQLDPANILLMTKLLAEQSGKDELRSQLQTNKSFLINSLYLLRMVHEASKGGSVAGLSLLSKLSDVERREGGDLDMVMESPAYGFKASLVQIITNLVWDNTDNKSLVGELDGIPLLLDCSQIDARNPLITQWVVLAIKGLTNEHTDNQTILAGLRREGAMEGSLIKELGLNPVSSG